MPNKNTHLVVALGIGATYTVVDHLLEKQENPKAEFDFSKLLRNVLIGGTVALLPDILEPVNNPNHRKLFHSWSMASLVAYFAFGKPSEKIGLKHREILRACALGYLSHLGADSTTPRGLPLI